jgi:hypothetical protein
MPIKLRPSTRSYDRATDSYTIYNYFLKNMSEKELFFELNKLSTRPKVKQKVRNELVRRGVKIVIRS